MNRKVFLMLFLLVFAGYAGWSFVDSLTPYVGVAQAKRASGSVQVKGLIDEKSVPHIEGGEFVFALKDEETGESMTVRYKGMKPDQFDQAHHVVAVGRYRDGAFRSDKLLIKCPSKYEQQKGT